ncbi:hypothetical protein KRR39_06810 [Nocardioides panacis]|uniref:Glycosyl hydrolase family protein n=1 Tax=Nocardioides panacis TaxID=2849501 RepID=A0A975T240_9ACTN|nr:hypothetical protein [Nocardioides panacis]QWZ09468.1 hypothetical protein KRR39_06810 [Nocardioides panacis]
MPPLRRSVSALLGLSLVGAALVATGPVEQSDTRPVSQSRPTNAGKVFRWGNAQWADDFIGPVKGMWAQNRPGQVNNQHGMLTINGSAGGGDVVAMVAGHARQYGRWETRVRAEQYTRSHTPYHVVAELVPVGDHRCGARSIVLSDYALGSDRARMAIRNLPNAEFTASKRLNLRPGPFHTYAVEVTPSHVSWFVDTRVVMTERRGEALSGGVVRVPLPARRPAGRPDEPGTDADGLAALLLAGPAQREVDRRPGRHPRDLPPRLLTRRLWRREARRPGASGGRRAADPATLAAGGPLTRRLWRREGR